jgi:NitT/TauT family transport system permease protein
MEEAVLEQQHPQAQPNPSVPTAPESDNRLTKRARRRLLFSRPTTRYPIGFGLLFVLLWQWKMFHVLFSLEKYQLPLPLDIAISIRDNIQVLTLYARYTGFEALGGFVAGSLLGLAAAILASFFPSFGKGGISVMASLNAIPIVALAPIMNNWFGEGVSSRIAVVAVLTMATMSVSAFKGLRSVEPSYLELMASYGADNRQLFLKLRFFHALPNLFAALKINMSTSMIGAIVGEFFISSRGLGYLLSDQIRLANMPLAWACIVIAAILGIAFYYLVIAAEKWLMPWHSSQR